MGRLRARHCGLVVERLRLEDDCGQVLIEYALLLSLVTLATIGVLRALGVDLSGLLNQIGTQMSVVSNP
jgi:Flp pilus assembly pilin Flp